MKKSSNVVFSLVGWRSISVYFSLRHSLSFDWLLIHNNNNTLFLYLCLSVSSRKPVIYIIECIHFYTKKLWWWIDCWDFCSTCVCAFNNGSESQKKNTRASKNVIVTFSFFHYFHDYFSCNFCVASRTSFI